MCQPSFGVKITLPTTVPPPVHCCIWIDGLAMVGWSSRRAHVWNWLKLQKIYFVAQKNWVGGCRSNIDCYCVCCELLSASIAEALQFINILVSGIFHGHFAQRLTVNKPCLQIVRRLLWKQTTTHSMRNNKPMFDRQPPTQIFWAMK